MLRNSAVILAVLLLTSGTACCQEKAELRFGAMGTEVHIQAYGPDRTLLEKAVQEARSEIDRVEALMTDWRPSPLTRLNERAGKGPAPVERELAAIIARGVALHQLTHGGFDITFAGVGSLWSFKKGKERLPNPNRIQEALQRVDASRITVAPETAEVTLPANMKIGLGGIAKGYSVDRAIAVLQNAGVQHAMVNAGGDLRVLGRAQGDTPWEIAIKHPRNADRAIAVFKLERGSLVTSGDYERFFERDGKRYHHIIDPRSGTPATGCMSATVLAPSAELADALATALCVLGPKDGLPLIETIPGAEALCVDLQGTVHTTAKLPTRIAPLP